MSNIFDLYEELQRTAYAKDLSSEDRGSLVKTEELETLKDHKICISGFRL